MPDVHNPQIDVLIVTLNARERVLSCLDHFRRQTVPHRVLLADNGGNANGAIDAVRARFPEVKVITQEENLGFGKAVNQLAALSHGEVIVLANDDMDVEPQFLETLIAPLSNERVGMVAGMTLQPGIGSVVDGFGIEADCTLLAFNRLRHRPPSSEPGKLLGPSGGAAAYRRRAWEAVGGLEPSFFAYAEDLDLALRLRLAGWEPAAAAGARGVHLGGATAGIDSRFQRQNAGFGRGFVLRRYGVLRGRHAPRALMLELLTVLNGLVRARTLLPVTSRLEGWRAAGRGPRLAIPAGAVDDTISWREALRRLAFER